MENKYPKILLEIGLYEIIENKDIETLKQVIDMCSKNEIGWRLKQFKEAEKYSKKQLLSDDIEQLLIKYVKKLTN